MRDLLYAQTPPTRCCDILLRLHLHLSNPDIALIAIVTAQSAVLSWLRQPRHKALVLTLPIPFTCGMIAVARPIDATHAIGMLNLAGFILMVRYLYMTCKVNIIASIACCIVLYCLLGVAIAQAMPIEVAQKPVVFYSCIAVVLATCLVMKRTLPQVTEEATRSPVPVAIKVPIIGAVVTALVLTKQLLAGFVVTFPFVSTVGAYEARKSLTTIASVFPRLIVALAMMLVVIREVELRSDRLMGLIAGWIAYLAMLGVARLMTRRGDTMAISRELERG